MGAGATRERGRPARMLSRCLPLSFPRSGTRLHCRRERHGLSRSRVPAPLPVEPAGGDGRGLASVVRASRPRPRVGLRLLRTGFWSCSFGPMGPLFLSRMIRPAGRGRHLLETNEKRVIHEETRRGWRKIRIEPEPGRIPSADCIPFGRLPAGPPFAPARPWSTAHTVPPIGRAPSAGFPPGSAKPPSSALSSPPGPGLSTGPGQDGLRRDRTVEGIAEVALAAVHQGMPVGSLRGRVLLGQTVSLVQETV